MFRETHSRSIVKALSYRLAGSLVTVMIVLCFSGKLNMAVGVGVADLGLKVVTYFLHERLWDRISYGRKRVVPSVVWLTGLSGSGKSTIADRVHQEIAKRGFRVERLDGDTIRNLFPSTGFTRPDRDAHIRRVGYLASKLEANDIFVVASFVSPYADARNFVRTQCGRFIEVYVSTPIEICEQRDVKGLYAKARRGELKNFTGVDDPYEVPEKPELNLDTSTTAVEACVDRVLSLLEI